MIVLHGPDLGARGANQTRLISATTLLVGDISPKLAPDVGELSPRPDAGRGAADVPAHHDARCIAVHCRAY
jgi:hypothetical protein